MRKVYVKESPIEGKGIFAAKNIMRGEIISFFKGKRHEMINKSEDDALANPYWIAIGKDTWMDTNPPLRFTNHSCEPNASIKGKVTLVAIKEIRKDDEITIDYSVTEGDPRWYMKCNCRKASCRKKITSIQSLPKKTYEKYLPYIPRFTQGIYKKINNYNG